MIYLVAARKNEDKNEELIIKILRTYKHEHRKFPSKILIEEGIKISDEFLWLLREIGIKYIFVNK